MNKEPKRLIDVLLKPALLWQLLSDYLSVGHWRKLQPVDDPQQLKEFLRTRASYVAQVSLYGYLRTRAGMRYPELFDDDAFVVSINIAKWQIWLACLSDLAVYAGGLITQNPRANIDAVSTLMEQVVSEVLDETGVPDDAGNDFVANMAHVQQRVANCNWQIICDDESPFAESPQALVNWAPIVEDLKQLDEEIVKNSIRFRWQKVRRELRRLLDAQRLLGLSLQGDH